MVLREVRGRVIDPWNRAALVATVTFPDSRREIEAFFPVE
jgi:hypothetical protein